MHVAELTECARERKVRDEEVHEIMGQDKENAKARRISFNGVISEVAVPLDDVTDRPAPPPSSPATMRARGVVVSID